MLTPTENPVASAPDRSLVSISINVLPAALESVADLQTAFRPVYDLSAAACAQQMTVVVGEAHPFPRAIDPACGLGVVYRYVNQLGELQEYRTKLIEAVRSLSHDISSWASSDVIVSTVETSMCGVAPHTEPLPTLGCDEFPSTIYVPGFAIYAADWLLSAHDFLQTELANFKCEIRRINNVLRIIRHATAWAVSFFCCVSWERRRWFLCHGARPPKTAAQAIVSLFSGAYFGPLFAS